MRRPGDKRYLNARGVTYELTVDDRGLWIDNEGGVWAFADDDASTDPIIRCGVGLLSLPASHPLTRACKPHDFKYSSPEYQWFHTRSEAEADLERDAKTVRWWGWTAPILKFLAHTFGGSKWENERTR